MPENKPDTSLPKIVPDKDDLRGFHSSGRKPLPDEHQSHHKTTPSIGLFVIFIIAAAGIGANYWLFTLYQTQDSELSEARKRIGNLEQRLSATGEEMDQSAVALQVKVTELSKKTNELWTQMDKLWASAWRRNQSELKALAENLQQSNARAGLQLNSMTKELNIAATHLEVLKEQLDSQQTIAEQLNRSIADVKTSSTKTKQLLADLQQKLTATQLQNQTISRQMKTLEQWRRSVQTQLKSGIPSATNSNSS